MNTQETIDLLKGLTPMQLPEDIAKSFAQGTGLVAYDLEPYAKTLYPVITPLRNKLPRVKANGGTATNWKMITSVNPSNMRAGVSEGNRSGIITDAVSDKVAAYRGLGLENFVTFEADYAAEGFDNARARAVQSLLNALMIQEERTILGGNSTLALGTTPTPSLTAVGSGGTLAAQTQSVICVALTHAAFMGATVSATGIPITATRTNADGSTDSIKSGAAQKSAAATAATVLNGSLQASVTPVNGAVAYAWYIGLGGSERLAAITTVNSYLFTAQAGGSNQLASALPASDDSQDSLVFDGVMAQLFTSGSGAIISTAATGTPGVGTVLTSDGAGGIVEWDAMFQSFWDASRTSPNVIYMSAASLLRANRLILANGGAPLIRFSMDSGGKVINSGTVIGSYLNKITNTQVRVEVHPDMPNGTFLFWSDSVPYPLANVANLVQMKLRQDYYQLEWPRRSRKYEYGVYMDGLLQMYFPPAYGLLRNYTV